jgi:hypothetical protein
MIHVSCSRGGCSGRGASWISMLRRDAFSHTIFSHQLPSAFHSNDIRWYGASLGGSKNL